MTLGDAMWSAHSFDEDELRLLNWTLAEERGGVMSIGDLFCTPQGTPNNTVSVATGQAIVPATSAGLHGAWHVPNVGALASPTFAATGASLRWDLLILRVDATTGVPSLFVVQGTAGVAAEPSLAGQENYVVLCRVVMPANKSIIDNGGVNGSIVDRRSLVPPYFVCTSTTRPPAPFLGMTIYETDTSNAYVCTTAGTPATWTQSQHLGAWTSYTPTLRQGASSNIAKTVNYSRLIKRGREVVWNFQVTATASGSAGSVPGFNLPFDAATIAAERAIGFGKWSHPAGPTDVLVTWFAVDGTPDQMFLQAADAPNNFPTTQILSGDVFHGNLHYEAAS